MNLVSLGEERIQKFGERASLVFEEREYTNTQINTMGKRLATGLQSLGIGQGDHVIVSLPNMPEVFACFGAIWRIGAVIVPIMFLLGENETRYILDHSDAKAVITSQDLLEKIENARKGIAHVKLILPEPPDNPRGSCFPTTIFTRMPLPPLNPLRWKRAVLCRCFVFRWRIHSALSA
jgi:acyl-CoA synthetase (AMP-forming)/AMP-acid ligase II